MSLSRAEFEKQRVEHERQEALARQANEDRAVALGTLRNATGLSEERLLEAYGDPGARLVLLKADGVEPVADSYFARVEGRPDAFTILHTGEQLPPGVDALEEASLREVIDGAVAERGAARRLQGDACMDDMSPEAARAERQAVERDVQMQLDLLHAQLPDLICDELEHALDDAGKALVRKACRKAVNGDDSILDEVLLTRQFVRHPGGGEAPAYKLGQWTPEGAAEAERPLSLEDSADGAYRVRTLRQLARMTFDKHAAILRYGARALAELPQFTGRLF